MLIIENWRFRVAYLIQNLTCTHWLCLFYLTILRSCSLVDTMVLHLRLLSRKSIAYRFHDLTVFIVALFDRWQTPIWFDFFIVAGVIDWKFVLLSNYLFAVVLSHAVWFPVVEASFLAVGVVDLELRDFKVWGVAGWFLVETLWLVCLPGVELPLGVKLLLQVKGMVFEHLKLQYCCDWLSLLLDHVVIDVITFSHYEAHYIAKWARHRIKADILKMHLAMSLQAFKYLTLHLRFKFSQFLDLYRKLQVINDRYHWAFRMIEEAHLGIRLVVQFW